MGSEDVKVTAMNMYKYKEIYKRINVTFPSTSLSLAFRAKFSLSKASTEPDFLERSVDHFNASEFIQKLNALANRIELSFDVKAFKSCLPSVPKTETLTGIVTCVEEAMKLVISVSFDRSLLRIS